MKGRSARHALVLLALFAGYVIAGKLCLRLASVHPSATAIWAPTGIALAAFLLLGARVWPAIFLGAFLVNITTEGSVLTTLGIAAGNTLEGLLGAWLVNRFANGRRAFEQPFDVLKAAVFAGLLSTMVSPTIGVASLSLGGYAQWRHFGSIWFTWWLGDVGGDLVVAPFLVLWGDNRRPGWTARKTAEVLVLLGGLLLVQLVVFNGLLAPGMRRYPLEYLAVPFLAWIALRFGSREAATATFLSSAVAVAGTLRGFGPFSTGTLNESLLLLAAYTSVLSLTILTLAAEVAERRRLEEERQRLFSELESQRESLLFLAEAGAVLNASLDYETTLASVARLVVPGIADWCSIDLLTDTGALRQLTVAHLDPAKVELARELNRRYPPDPNAPIGAAQVIRTGKPELIEEIPDNLILSSAWDEDHRRILQQLGLVSFMCVPLSARGRTIGAISFLSAESGRRFDATDLNLAGQLAGLAANAVDNALLYAEAEKAVRTRDDFLSVAGHELRTPLNAAYLLAQNLHRQVQTGAPTPRLAERTGRIKASMERINGLIDELLDVSRISEGRLELEPAENVDLAAIVQESASRLEEELRRAGCTVSLRSRPIPGYWDRKRLDQMVTNLLSNAIKYGKGKPIEIEVDAEGGRARLRVTDHGIGISLEDQSRIFRRFERAVSGRHYGGLGLGLWIVRQIVESSGGSVRVESELDQGATFVVELPCTKIAQESS